MKKRILLIVCGTILFFMPHLSADEHPYTKPNFAPNNPHSMWDDGRYNTRIVFKLFNKLDTQREEGEKVLTGIVDRNYDMLNKLEGRLAELSARLQNVEREVERIRS